MTFNLDMPLERFIGKVTARKLARLQVNTARELLYHFPRRFDKWGDLTPMSQLYDGADVTVMAQVMDVQSRQTRNRKWQLIVTLTDGSSQMDAVFWAKNRWVAEKAGRKQSVWRDVGSRGPAG